MHPVPSNRVTRCFLARLRSGFGGESERQVHIFTVPEKDIPPPARLWAQCQAVFKPDELEILDKPRGMPCVTCLAVTPVDVEMI